ncbi:MAG: methyltransferase domain-containing protein [Nitrospiraceae bacterium]
MKYSFAEYCVCPRCRAELSEQYGWLQCVSCGVRYEVRDGIPMLLPNYESKQEASYFDCYQEIAKDDLSRPLEERRDVRHAVLLKFIGNVKKKKVLDIGSSNALYLRKLDAAFKVAFDLAVSYLAAVPKEDGIARICGDAEYLPFKAGFFDVIVISGILEHLLHPDRLVQLLRSVCSRDTRVIVEIPWEEDLGQYRNANYEFTHLRSFSAYKFAELWRGFYIKRARSTYPSLEDPIFFRLGGKIPRVPYNVLVHVYFESNLWKREYEHRVRWIDELPRRERWLLIFYKPKFRMFELRTLKRSVWAYAFWKIRQGVCGLSRRQCHDEEASGSTSIK